MVNITHKSSTLRKAIAEATVLVSKQETIDAIDACNEMVETIKKELPIWGKEICTDDSTAWKQNN